MFKFALKIVAYPIVALLLAVALPFILAAVVLFDDTGSDVEPRK